MKYKITKILQFLGALTLRPYGCTSVWSANGYIKVKWNVTEVMVL